MASDLGLRSHPADPLPWPQDAPSPPQMNRLVLLVSVLAVVAIATVGSAATSFPRLGRLSFSPTAHRQLAATCQGKRATAMLTSFATAACDPHRGNLEPSSCSPTAPLHTYRWRKSARTFRQATGTPARSSRALDSATRSGCSQVRPGAAGRTTGLLQQQPHLEPEEGSRAQKCAPTVFSSFRERSCPLHTCALQMHIARRTSAA